MGKKKKSEMSSEELSHEGEIDEKPEFTSEWIEEEKEPELMTEKEVHKKFHKFKKP